MHVINDPLLVSSGKAFVLGLCLLTNSLRNDVQSYGVGCGEVGVHIDRPLWLL